MKTYSLENPFLDNSYLLEATDGSIKPIAGIFIEIAEDGLAKIKNSNSTFQNVDISNNPNAKYTHDLIFNGTISIKIKAAGGEAVTVESTILTPEQLTEINSLIGGEMDSINGYTINLYQLIYKLILWEYINATYTITLKPFVIYANITNVNDNTTALNYTIPTTKITANKEVVSITTDPNLIIWSDGTIRNCENLESNYTGPGEGNIYLIGNYTKLESSNQSISAIENIFYLINSLILDNNQISIIDISQSSNLETLDLSNNTLLNVENVNIASNLTYLNLSNTKSKLTNISSNANLLYLNLSNTQSELTSISDNINLTYLNLSESNSVITTVEFNVNLVQLILDRTESKIVNLETNTDLKEVYLFNTDSKITTVAQNIKLTHLYLHNTDSNISNIDNNVNLTHLYLFNTDCVINDISNNINLRNISIGSTDSNISNIDNNVNLEQAYLYTTQSSLTDISNNINLILLHIYNTNCKISNVENNINLRYLYLQSSNTTATDTNDIMEDIKNENIATGIRELKFTANGSINQSDVNILVVAGWDVIQL